MSRLAPPLLSPAAADDLTAAVIRIARRLAGADAEVGRVAVRPAAYLSSHPAAEVRLRVNGRPYHFLVKDLEPRSVPDSIRTVRPRFATNPNREPRIYAEVLTQAQVGAPRCWGTVIGPGRRWLFLEFVRGHPLAEEGALAVWEQAVAWSARLHARFPASRVSQSLQSYLIRVNRAWLTRWARRAVRIVGHTEATADHKRALRRVAAAYDRVVEGVLAWPGSLTHGDYFAANILVTPRGREGGRICPVDWESAALGPGLLDLAAVTAGDWPDPARATLAKAYYEALPTRGRPGLAQFREALDWCRMHLAVQCLGWAAGWRPPEPQAHDWLGDVVLLADRFGL